MSDQEHALHLPVSISFFPLHHISVPCHKWKKSPFLLGLNKFSTNMPLLSKNIHIYLCSQVYIVYNGVIHGARQPCMCRHFICFAYVSWNSISNWLVDLILFLRLPRALFLIHCSNLHSHLFLGVDFSLFSYSHSNRGKTFLSPITTDTDLFLMVFLTVYVCQRNICSNHPPSHGHILIRITKKLQATFKIEYLLT